MKLLCIDTALASCSVCAYDAASAMVLAAERQLMAKGHAEALAPMVARVMAKAGLVYGDLNRIAVTTGPGTFTGIRVGLSFARAMGLARGIKVLGVNSMVATQACLPADVENAVIIHQAGMSGLSYYYDGAEIALLSPADIVSRLGSKSTILVGTGADAVLALLPGGNAERLPQFDLPSAAGFAAYAAARPDPDHMPEPLYLREADAKPQRDPLRAVAGLAVRPTQPDELALLAKLHGACFDPGWSETEISNLLASPGIAALMAQTDDGVIGFLIYRAVADEAEIITIGVDPALRRRGAGKGLLVQAVDLLKSFAIKHLFLEVATSNVEAIGLYQSAGFKQVGLRKAYYAHANRPAEDALVLALQLA